MADRGAEQTLIRLQRVRRGLGGYRFDHDGVGYRVLRSTDGTLGSAVIWDVEIESEPGRPVASFTTLTDLRRRFRG